MQYRRMIAVALAGALLPDSLSGETAVTFSSNVSEADDVRPDEGKNAPTDARSTEDPLGSESGNDSGNEKEAHRSEESSNAVDQPSPHIEAQQATEPGSDLEGEEHTLADVLEDVRDPSGSEVLSDSIDANDTSQDATYESGATGGVDIAVSPTGRVGIAPEGMPDLALDFPDVAIDPLAEEASGGILAYEMEGESIFVPQVDDHVFRALFAIQSPESAAEYEFHISGETGVTLTPQDDGGISVLDVDGAEIGLLGAPWARTADNSPVPTEYRVSGNSVTQVVDLAGLPASAFPVIADPAVYVNSVSRKVINQKSQGRIAKWKYLASCRAMRRAPACTVKAELVDEKSVQVALGISVRSVSASLGFTASATKKYGASCSSRRGPSTARMFRSALKKTYRVQRTVKRGVPGVAGQRVQTTVSKSGILTAYIARNDWTCSVS